MTLHNIYDEIISKLKKEAREIGSSFPHVGVNGKWDDMENKDITWWTNGYWPGILWQMYDITEDENFKNIAIECETKLDKALELFQVYTTMLDLCGEIVQLRAIT